MRRPYEIVRSKLRSRKFVFSLLVATLLAGVILFYNISVHTILPGEAGVIWHRFGGGTEVDYVYPEGMHIIAPYDKLYIYNIRLQEIRPRIRALTKNGLELDLSLSIRCAPKVQLLGLLHKKVGPNYANIVVLSEIENVLREIIGTLDAEQIYTTGHEVIVEAVNDAIERVAQRYINVDAVLIKKIKLPTAVMESVEYKVTQKHLVEAHELLIRKEEKEARRKRLEGEGIRDQLTIIASALPEGEIIRWLGVNAMLELARSDNAKVVVIGSPETGFPIIGNVHMTDLNASGPTEERAASEASNR